jgi:hypothetical protein
MEGTSSSGRLEIGISCFTGPHLGTGGQKHTPLRQIKLYHLNVKYIHKGWQVSVHYHTCIHQDKNGLQKITNYTNPVVPMEITFMDNGGNIFVLDEFIEQKNLYR